MQSCFTLALLLATIGVRLTRGQTCFYHDGSAADDLEYEICGGEDTTFSSTCCDIGRGDVCRRNGLCSYTGNYDYRGACSSENWDQCQDICPGINNSTWVQVRECATNEYCCVLHEDRDCCTNGADRFSLSAPNPNSSSDGGDGLSTGSIGGIAGSVGGIAAAATGIAIWWYLRRHQKKKKAAKTATTQQPDMAMTPLSPNSQAPASTVVGSPSPFHDDKKGVDPSMGYELPGSSNITEMAANEARPEADSIPVTTGDGPQTTQPKFYHEMPA